MPGEGINQSLPMRIIMQQHHRRLTARIGIGQQKPPQPTQQSLGRRQRISRRPSRADRGTGTATRTNLRTDHHLVLEWPHPRRNGASWAEIKAARAAFALVARMGAKLAVECHETRLVETADQFARRHNGALQCRRIGRIGAQIALPHLMRREKRRRAGQIQDDIRPADRAILALAPGVSSAGGWARRRRTIYRHFKSAKIAAGRARPASHDGEIRLTRRRHRHIPAQQNGDVELFLQAGRGGQRYLIPAQHQGDARAFQVHQGYVRHGLGGGGDQRGHFRPGLFAFSRPAGSLTDIDEDRGGGAGGLGLLGEKRGLGGAGDGEWPAGGERGFKAIKLRQAKLLGATDFNAGATTARQGFAIQQHGIFATAHQGDPPFFLSHDVLSYPPGCEVCHARHIWHSRQADEGWRQGG